MYKFKLLIISIVCVFVSFNLFAKENLYTINIENLQKIKTKEIKKLLTDSVATGYFNNRIDFIEIYKKNGTGFVIINDNVSNFIYKIQGSKISYKVDGGWQQVRLFQKKVDSERNGEYYFLQKNQIIAKITKLQSIEEYEIAVQQQIEREKKEAEEKRLAEEKREKEKKKKLEEQKKAEEKRIAELKKAQEKKLAQEKKKEKEKKQRLERFKKGLIEIPKPFGLEFGKKVIFDSNNYKHCTSKLEGLYYICDLKVPKPSEQFSGYVVKLDNLYNLYEISAFHSYKEQDLENYEIFAKNLINLLEEKYDLKRGISPYICHSIYFHLPGTLERVKKNFSASTYSYITTMKNICQDYLSYNYSSIFQVNLEPVFSKKNYYDNYINFQKAIDKRNNIEIIKENFVFDKNACKSFINNEDLIYNLSSWLDSLDNKRIDKQNRINDKYFNCNLNTRIENEFYSIDLRFEYTNLGTGYIEILYKAKPLLYDYTQNFLNYLKQNYEQEQSITKPQENVF